MYILLSIIFSIIGILLAISTKIEETALAYKFALMALWLSLIATICNALFFFSGIKSSIVKEGLLFIYNWGKLFWFLITAMLTTILYRITFRQYKLLVVPNSISRNILKLTIISATILCATFFFMVTIGKSKSYKEMEQFFVQSGYPAFFNYVVMVIECIFSVGLLLHFKLKSGFISAIILMIFMFGAFLTHFRNSDPLSDSYDAFMQILILTLLIILYKVEKKLYRQKLKS
ncbi:DoxX family protein [Ferruginibacter sp.]|nr:DoxX family protein [Ferruginibacter sp.]